MVSRTHEVQELPAAEAVQAARGLGPGFPGARCPGGGGEELDVPGGGLAETGGAARPRGLVCSQCSLSKVITQCPRSSPRPEGESAGRRRARSALGGVSLFPAAPWVPCNVVTKH